MGINQYVFFREFQHMAFVFYNNFLSSDQDTNRFVSVGRD